MEHFESHLIEIISLSASGPIPVEIDDCHCLLKSCYAYLFSVLFAVHVGIF